MHHSELSLSCQEHNDKIFMNVYSQLLKKLYLFKGDKRKYEYYDAYKKYRFNRGMA